MNNKKAFEEAKRKQGYTKSFCLGFLTNKSIHKSNIGRFQVALQKKFSKLVNEGGK